MHSATSPATESTYIVRDETSSDAIRRSLEALLPTRHRLIARHRFTVLDTFDGRVRRAGTRLTRHGVNGHSSVAWERRGGGNPLTVRLTEPVNFAWDLPEGPLQHALAPVIGPRRLLAQADAEQYGSLLEILDERGKTVARLRIESGRARLPGSRGGWQPLPTVITLTGLRGYEDTYRRVVPVVESRPGVEPCPEGLHGLVLRQVGAPERGDLASLRINLEPTVRANVGARRVHLALLGLLEANEPGLRQNLDTEFLHDFRVAVRRTRSLLGQIRHVFPPDVVQHFSTEFSWLGSLTGPPRDMDVLVLALRTNKGAVPPGDMEALTALLSHAQQDEHRALVAALDSDRYRRLLADWKTFLQQPGSPAPEMRNADRLLADVIGKRAWRLTQRIADAAPTVDERTPAERLHQVRIHAKKLRYLVDVAPAFCEAPDLHHVLAALKKLQRVLGDFNDASVQELRLLECGRAPDADTPAGVLLALGRLAEQRRQRRELLRGEVVDALARFCARDTRSACRRAFKRSERAR